MTHKLIIKKKLDSKIATSFTLKQIPVTRPRNKLIKLNAVIKHLLCEIMRHFLGKYPVGHCRAFDQLYFQHFINQNANHLLMIPPQFVNTSEYT
jgi:hypothetical protein